MFVEGARAREKNGERRKRKKKRKGKRTWAFEKERKAAPQAEAGIPQELTPGQVGVEAS